VSVQLVAGQVFRYPFVFGDGCPTDGKSRPVVVVLHRPGSNIIMPISACCNARPDGHKIIPLDERGLREVWPGFIPGVIVLWPKVCSVERANPIGCVCKGVLYALQKATQH
jgi:hypothetical protein